MPEAGLLLDVSQDIVTMVGRKNQILMKMMMIDHYHNDELIFNIIYRKDYVINSTI